MPTESWAVRCDDLVKVYRTATGEVRALNGITVAFPRSAVTAVVGPSGSGKSSLLRLLCGMDQPTSGAIRVGDVSVHTATPRELRRLRRHGVGYVFQRPSDNFVSYLSVEDHLRIAAHDAGRNRRADARRLLDEVGIAGRADHLPSQLSGGEQQRAAFAAALAGGARIVVADELTAELDSGSAAAVLEKVRALAETGITFILATHDRNVTRAADEVIELDHGFIASERPETPPEPAAPFVWTPVGRPHRDRAFEGIRSPVASTSAPPTIVEPTHRPLVAEARGLSKSYERGREVVHAVQGASFSLRAGEVVGLIGRSGAGKTTLLNLLAGWEHTNEGEIRWSGGLPWNGVPRWRDLAVLPQRLGLIPELTVRENIEYPARLDRRLAETRDVADRLIEDLGLGRLQHRYPRETSVGEQQRAALARALVLGPRLMLADEPTGHQDRASMEAVYAALRGAALRGTCALVATHDEQSADHVDRVLRISDGRIG